MPANIPSFFTRLFYPSEAAQRELAATAEAVCYGAEDMLEMADRPDGLAAYGAVTVGTLERLKPNAYGSSWVRIQACIDRVRFAFLQKHAAMPSASPPPPMNLNVPPAPAQSPPSQPGAPACSEAATPPQDDRLSGAPVSIVPALERLALAERACDEVAQRAAQCQQAAAALQQEHEAATADLQARQDDVDSVATERAFTHSAKRSLSKGSSKFDSQGRYHGGLTAVFEAEPDDWDI